MRRKITHLIGADNADNQTIGFGRFPEVPTEHRQPNLAVAKTSRVVTGGRLRAFHGTSAEQSSDRVLASGSSGNVFSGLLAKGLPAGRVLASALFFFLLCCSFCLVSSVALAQMKSELYLVSGTHMSRPDRPYLPEVAIKSNLLYLATTTLNASFEFGLGRRWTLDLAGAYNPFQLQPESTNQIWFAQPELRYWFCQRFERHFLGLHAIYGEYNIGQVDYLTPTFLTHRFEGRGYGAGISWGYHASLGGRWAMEFSVGAGYLHLDYDKYRCYECDELAGSETKQYFGPTKAAVSMIFMIK